MDKSTKPLTKSRKDNNYERDLEDSMKHENDKTTNQLLSIAAEIKKSALSKQPIIQESEELSRLATPTQIKRTKNMTNLTT